MPVRVARWLLALAIFASTMAIGAVHVAVLALVTAVLLAAAVLAWWPGEPLRSRRSATVVFWTGAGLTLWTALSIVPLRADWLAALSPHAADVWARSLTALGRPGPEWATLSLDPVATRIQLLRGVAYVLAFITASRIAARREGVVFLESALLITVLALAVAALVHPALGAEKVFGLYTPKRDPGLRHVAPILNRNTLAGYLTIGLSITLGHLFTPRSLWPRTLLAAFAAGLVGMEVWLASRGGMLATVLAVALVAWMSRARNEEQRGLWGPTIVPTILVLIGVGITVLASSNVALAKFTNLETSKLDLARDALRIVPDFPVFGVGRGAFESVFPAYRVEAGHITYAYPENVVAQWVTEWGVVPALLGFGALAVALRSATAMARSPRAAGPWAALACLGVQNLVDFGSEYPAMIIALAACAGIVTGGTSGAGVSRKVDAWARRPRALAAVAVVATLGAGLLVVPAWGHELAEDRTALHASALDAAVTRADFERLAEAAMLRHPAEPYLPFTGALRAVRAGDASLMPWIERTVERAVFYGPAHVLLARWLTPRSPSQARFEYHLALEQAPEQFAYVWPKVLELVHGYDDAMELLPRSSSAVRAGWAGNVAAAIASRLPATARRLDDIVGQTDPSDAGVAERRAREGLADVLAGAAAPWCTGERRAGCLKDALARAARLEAIAPTKCLGHSIHARLVFESGDPTGALKELRVAADSVADRTTCLKDLTDLATLARSDEAVSQALDRIAHAGCADAAECVGNLRFVAQREIARGNPRSGLSALRRATVAAPQDDDVLAEFAGLAAQVDLHVDALRAYDTLSLRKPSDPRWPAAAAAEKAALMKVSLPY